MTEIQNLGKRVIDIGQLVDVFEAQEGEIQHIIGKTGNGKTYEGTRRALDYLRQGYTVYTTWQLIIPPYYDEREDKGLLFWKTLLMKKRFYKFDFKNNWHFLDIDRPDLIQYLAGLTDCIVFLDEGQDIFDSRERIEKSARKVLTRMRHMRKTLIIISQRAQAVDVTARANVTYYYKCVKTRPFYWPFNTLFKVYRTEEMDQQNFPIWEDLMTEWQAPVWQSHFARKEIYNSYNSWYLRQGIPNSQEVSFEAYDLSLFDVFRAFFSKKPRPKAEPDKEVVDRIERSNHEKWLSDTTFTAKNKVKKSSEVIHRLSTPPPTVPVPVPLPVKIKVVHFNDENRQNKVRENGNTPKIQGAIRSVKKPKDIIRKKQGKKSPLVLKK